VDLYIHCPIRLHGVVLHYLSTGTTLHFFRYVSTVTLLLDWSDVKGWTGDKLVCTISVGNPEGTIERSRCELYCEAVSER
jgi:hypothetical protein